MKQFVALSILLLLAFSPLQAGIEPTLTATQAGTAFIGVTAPPVFSNTVPGFGTAGWVSNFTLKSVSNLVKLSYDQNSTTYIGYDFNLSVPVKITYTPQTGAPVTVNEVLTINYFYDPAAANHREYRSADAYRFSGGCKVEVQVNGQVTATRPSAGNAAITGQDLANLAKTVSLQSEITLERYYNFNASYQHNATNFTPPTVISASNELEIRWAAIAGAEEYDLEWIFVDDYGPVNYLGFVSAANLSYDFNLNAARVQVKDLSYRIPLVYEHGYLLFRVRGIGRSATDNFISPVPGVWSCGTTNQTSCNSSRGVVGNYDLRCLYKIGTAYENDKMNWQAVTTYAEEGKKKTVVKHLDGTMRDRQAVTVLSSERMALVGESIYDHQGRAAIQVLPAPVNDATIRYYRNFNQNAAKQPYSRADFDKDISKCQTSTSPMRAENASVANIGAANYYSPFNLNMAGLIAPLIPHAEQYPFTQTEFMPDNTGRVRRQSGVGLTHKLGNGHETQYFYGTPVQEELDHLFGNEMGNAVHYKKNMVMDANGQLSLTYMDPKGNTIATALAGVVPTIAGTSPEQPRLLPLDSYKTTTFNVNLLATNVRDEANYSLTTVRTLLVNTKSDYKFSYTMTGEQFQDLTCMKAGVCYDCIYDLELFVVDNLNCNDTLYHFSKTIGNLMALLQRPGKPDTLVVSDKCENPRLQFNSVKDLPAVVLSTDPDFNALKLEVGSYTVVKRLKVNAAAAGAYADHFIHDPSNKCSQKKEDFEKNELAKVDTVDCNIRCGDIDASAINNPNLTPEEVKDLKAEIADLQDALCDSTLTLCETAYAAMLADVSPGGQYGYIPGAPPTNPEDPSVSVYLVGGANVAGMGLPPYYWNSSLAFNDEAGNPVMVDLGDGNGPMKINDSRVPPDVFANHWRDEWAAQLVKFHPEYPYYEFCSDYLQKVPAGKTHSSETYDSDMAETFTFYGPNGALAKGFVSNSNPLEIRDKDPFFSSAVFPLGLPSWMNYNWATDAGNKINAFATEPTNPSNKISIKQLAIAMTNCPTDPALSCKNQPWSTVPATADKEWATYRALYTSVKQQFLYKIRSQYAMQKNAYNGCIGADPFRRYREGFDGIPHSAHPFHSPLEYCGEWTYQHFKHKAKRFPSVYDALPKDYAGDFYADQPTAVLNNIYQLNSQKMGGMCCDMETHFLEFVLAILKKNQTPLTLQAGNPAYPADVLNVFLNGQPTTTVKTIITNNLDGSQRYHLQFQSGCHIIFNLKKPANTTIADICCFSVGPSGVGTFGMKVTYSNGSTEQVSGFIESCPVKCDTPEPECPISEEASELVELFNHLMLEQKLSGNIALQSGAVGPYLAPYVGGINRLLSWIAVQTPTGYDFTIMQPRIPGCTIHLNLTSGATLSNMVQCLGIRPDLSKLDANKRTYDFFLRVKLGNNSIVELSGSSNCFPITFCCTTKDANGKPLPLSGLNTPETMLKNCRNCAPLTITGGIFGTPKWSSGCLTDCDSIVEYTIPLPDPCAQDLINLARYNAEKLYGYYLDSLKAAVRDAYMRHCLKAAETFTVEYEDTRHHFTLYYYDQANNLVRTVPPAGIGPLTAAQTAQIANYRKGQSVLPVYPAHTLVSYYRYNSLNQLTWQKIPDHKLQDQFFYDGLGRLVASINAKQRTMSGGRHFSYTRYDALGRIMEVGQSRQPSTGNYAAFLASLHTKARDYKNWGAYVNAGTRTEITLTQYDRAVTGLNGENLRGRVASVTWQPTISPAAGATSQLWYSYDIHGNVKTFVQKSFLLDPKTVEYDYDLVSGKVNSLAYQRNQPDQFLHRYAYDADNRLTEVRTSPDGVFWDRDAAYQYYKHGPLARTELGHDHVQGLDYAYTLHGWIKGVNSASLRPDQDMGKDGNTLAQGFARDAFGYLLSYYDGDYKSIGTGTTNTAVPTAAASLFNGNIRQMVTAIEPFIFGNNSGTPLASDYAYDQLNRLRTAGYNQPSYNKISGTWQAGPSDQRWRNELTYDANGNILKQKRSGNQAASSSLPFDMDDMTYTYTSGTNQLWKVNDAVPASNYVGIDIDDQGSGGNYSYDFIGNLTNDAAEGLVIAWNLQGKVSKITDSSPAQTIDFGYNPMGNRVLKTVNGLSTYHALDASGNVLATYRRLANGKVILESSWIFGSSRLGEYRAELCVGGTCLAIPQNGHSYHLTGKRRYEESNHLGNVLAVVSDRKLAVPGTPVNTVIENEPFNAGNGGWTANGGGVLTNAAPNLGGLKISGNNPNDGGARKLAIVPGQNYTLKFDLNFGNTSGNVSVMLVQKMGGNYNNFNQTFAAGTNTITFTAADESYLNITLKNAGTGQFFFIDNLILTKMGTTPVDYFAADVVGAQDYYAFGMLMAGRNFNSGTYRYSLGGHENDQEVKGNGNQIDFGDRCYDSRLGRFMSIDPIGSVFPWQSPYAYALNSLITFIDAEGVGPKKPAINSGTPRLRNIINGARTLVHNLTAFIIGDPKPLGPNDVTEFDPYWHPNRNFEDTYNIVPNQSIFWYKDFDEYDHIEIWSPGPPLTLLWETGIGDNRECERDGLNYKSTNRDSKFRYNPEDISGKNLEHGWASYSIPASFPKIITIKVNAIDPPYRMPGVYSDGSIWGFYIRNPDSPPPSRNKDGKQSHMNVRFLGGEVTPDWDFEKHPYDETGAEFPEDLDDE